MLMFESLRVESC